MDNTVPRGKKPIPAKGMLDVVHLLGAFQPARERERERVRVCATPGNKAHNSCACHIMQLGTSAHTGSRSKESSASKCQSSRSMNRLLVDAIIADSARVDNLFTGGCRSILPECAGNP